MTEYEAWLAEQGIEDDGWGLERWSRGDGGLRCYRDEAIKRFSHAILTGFVVEQLRPHGPFLEVGAGTGYWAYELGRAGVGCIATDPDPYHDTPHEDPELWVEVERLDAVAAIRKHPGRTLLISWPREWAADALMEFERAGGRRLVYIGEPAGGCTAGDAFFAGLKSWTLQHTLQLPNWHGIRDYGSIYARS